MSVRPYRRGASPEALALLEFVCSLSLARKFNPTAVPHTLEAIRRRASELIGAGCEQNDRHPESGSCRLLPPPAPQGER